MDASGWHVIVLAGQSNRCEVGLGPWTDTSAANDSRIFIVGRYPRHHHADMAIVPAIRPLDFWNPGEGHGGGLSLARNYIAAGYLPSGYNLVLVAAAAGSTSILQWNKVIAGTDGFALWDDMIVRTDVALALPNASPRIFSWWQMETDVSIAKHPSDPNHALMPDANAYLAQELTLHDNFRSRYGVVPVIRSTIVDDWLPGDPTKNAFLSAVQSIPTLRPKYGLTDTAGLGSNTPYLGTPSPHFSADAQEIITYRDIYQTYAALAA